jgi:5-bromo-4-chloroindolyl phosphate hydrolysis protein
MGVSEEDYVQKYKNLDDIIQQRVGVKPLQKDESIHILKSKEEDEHVRDTQRIFKMVQQEEQNQEQQKKFWSHFLQLRG